jgi:hypothetical protein
MATRIEIEGLGIVEVDDSFRDKSPQEQDAIVAEITQQVRASQSPKDTSLSTGLKHSQLQSEAGANQFLADVLGNEPGSVRSAFNSVVDKGRELVVNPVRTALGFDALPPQAQTDKEAAAQLEAQAAQKRTAADALNYGRKVQDIGWGNLSDAPTYIAERFITQMPQMAVSGLAPGLGFLNSAGSMNEELRQIPGLDTDTRLALASIVGAGVSTLDAAGLSVILKGLPKNVVAKIASPEVAEFLAKKGIAPATLRAAVAGASEGGTEVVQTGMEVGAAAAAGKEFQEGEIADRFKEAALVGTGGGAGARATIDATGKTAQTLANTSRYMRDLSFERQVSAQSPEQTASDLRVGRLFDAMKASQEKANTGTAQADDVTFKKVQDRVSAELKSSIRKLYESDQIDKDTYDRLIGRKDNILKQADQHNRDLSQEDLDVLQSLPLEPAVKQGLIDSFRDLNTITNAGMKKNARGPLERAAKVALPVAAGVLAPPTMGGSLAALGAKGLVTAGARKLDSVLGLQTPEILRRIRVAQRRNAGAAVGDTAHFLSDLGANAQAGVNVQNEAAAQETKSQRLLRAKRRMGDNPGLGGFDRYIYDQTGLLPSEVDKGLLKLVADGTITSAQQKSFYQAPKALKEGNQGNVIMDMLNDMAVKGELKRDGGWQGLRPEARPSTQQGGTEGIRNIYAYRQTMANVADATATAQQSAPTPELRQAVNDIASAPTPQAKAALFEQIKAANPQHAQWLDEIVAPITKFGPKDAPTPEAAQAPSSGLGFMSTRVGTIPGAPPKMPMLAPSRDGGSSNDYYVPAGAVEGLNLFDGSFNPRDKTAYISLVEVDPSMTRRGIARKAVTDFEEWARSKGAKVIQGEALPGVRGFWKKLGYKVSDEYDEEGNSRFEKDLSTGGGLGVRPSPIGAIPGAPSRLGPALAPEFRPAAGKPPVERNVVAAAVRYKGRTYQGPTHLNALELLPGFNGLDPNFDLADVDEGFLTDSGDFISRKEAAAITRRASGAGELFSENYRGPLRKAKTQEVSNRLPISEVAREEARIYKAKKKIATPELTEHLEIDESYLREVGDYLENAKHDPKNPEVRRAYDALIKETVAQFKAIGKDLKVTPFKGEGEPYRNSREAMQDIVRNRHLYYFRTESGFGEGADTSDHPMLEGTGIKDADGNELVANDVFRIVHDYFGHSQNGFQFGPKGEYNAFQEHARMYSPAAVPALAAETLAQNAWVNFGPHMRTPEAQKLTQKERRFADQKAFIVPWSILAKDRNPEGIANVLGLAPQVAPRGDRISTRQPTTKGALEDPRQSDLQIDLESMKRSPKAFEHNMAVLKTYPGFKTDATEPDEIAKDFIEHVKGNLLWLFDQVPEDVRQQSRRWYDGASSIASHLAAEYALPKRVTAAVLAALSPQKDWYQNVSLAERVLDIFHTKSDIMPDEKMAAAVPEAFQKYPAMLGVVLSRPLRFQPDAVHKAMWIRLYDEAHNPRSYSIITPEGDKGPDSAYDVAWGSLSEIAKAVSALTTQSREELSDLMGAKHKVRSFYNNIVDPTSDRGDVTIDTHAVAAGLLRPLAGSHAEVFHNFGESPMKAKQPKGWVPTKKVAGAGTVGLYGLYADAYRAAAAERGVLPREMQSITWEAVRGLFPYAGKTSKKALKPAIDNIWRRYQNGELSLDEARSQIHERAGGIEPPSWLTGRDTGADEDL